MQLGKKSIFNIKNKKLDKGLLRILITLGMNGRLYVK